MENKDFDKFNAALAPIKYENRTVAPLGFSAVWFGMVVQITGFAALAALTNYFTIGELLWIYIVGSLLLTIGAVMIQDLGLKHGLSFATTVAASFGYKGGKIASFIRMLPSLIFFALNAYLGATAINELFKIVFDFDNVFVALTINVVALIVVTLYGMKGIGVFSSAVAPLLLVVGLYMFWLVLDSYNVSFGEVLDMGGGLGEKSWLFGIAALMGLFIPCVLSANDYTRDCKINSNEKSWYKMNNRYAIASLFAIVPALTFFSILGNMTIVLSGQTNVLVVISELIQEKSVFLAIVIQVFIIVAQLSTNTAANLLPCAYVVCGYFPKKLSFKKSVIAVAIVSVALQPWNYYNHLDSIMNFFSILTGPAVSIIVVDYYIFRKRALDIKALVDINGKYKYWKGFNTAAIFVYFASGIVGYLITPSSSFFISTPLAAISYYLLAKVQGKKYPVAISEDVLNKAS